MKSTVFKTLTLVEFSLIPIDFIIIISYIAKLENDNIGSFKALFSIIAFITVSYLIYIAIEALEVILCNRKKLHI